jgi:hypothetical protein
MTQFSKKAALFILTVAVLAGCKKDSSNNVSLTQTQLLTSGSWKMTSYYLDPPTDDDRDGHLDHEQINSFPACVRDDLFFFKADGAYIHDAGTLKCSPSGPQIEEEGKWNLSVDNSVLFIGDPGSQWPWHLAELTANVLKIENVDTVAGVIYTERITFQH